LYDGSHFQSIAVCLDSGKLAGPACHADPRGDRTVYANVYPGDGPTETCDKHIMVDYCITGGGVATEYCSSYPDAEVGSRALVRMTPEEIQEIRDAANCGLQDMYKMDGYVYYLGEEGWHGFSGNANFDV